MADAKPGRNDPCRCGSGKKYKKCCLDKDEAAARAAAPAPPAQPSPPERRPHEARPVPAAPIPAAPTKPPRPEPTAEDRWWLNFTDEAFTARSPDEALACLRRALDEGPEPEGEWLLDGVGKLIERLQDAGRHAELMAWIEAAEARFPKAFEETRAYFAQWRFESALERSDVDLVEEARRFGPHVAEVSGLVEDLPGRLAWEGRVAALRALTERAWPALLDIDWSPQVLDEWAAYGVTAVLVDRLERAPDLSADDPALLSEMAPFFADEEEKPAELTKRMREYARRWIALLGGRGELPVDASILPNVAPGDEVATTHLTNLVAAVAGALRRTRGWSRSRAAMLLGDLSWLLSACASHPQNKATKQTPGSVVLPPPALLVELLGQRYVAMFVERHHVTAAVIFAMPAWAREAVARGWVSEQDAAAWLRQVMDAQRDALRARPAAPIERILRDIAAFVEGEGRELAR